MSCEECRYKFDCPDSYSEVSEHCSFYDKPTLPAYLSLEDVVHKLMRMTACGPSAQIRDVVAQVLNVRPADVETVHLIRCKDCKRVETNNCPMYRAHFGYTDEDYCSCGERKEPEHE